MRIGTPLVGAGAAAAVALLAFGGPSERCADKARLVAGKPQAPGVTLTPELLALPEPGPPAQAAAGSGAGNENTGPNGAAQADGGATPPAFDPYAG